MIPKGSTWNHRPFIRTRRRRRRNTAKNSKHKRQETTQKIQQQHRNMFPIKRGKNQGTVVKTHLPPRNDNQNDHPYVPKTQPPTIRASESECLPREVGKRTVGASERECLSREVRKATIGRFLLRETQNDERPTKHRGRRRDPKPRREPRPAQHNESWSPRNENPTRQPIPMKE
jgi:hypothetical protein